MAWGDTGTLGPTTDAGDRDTVNTPDPGGNLYDFDHNAIDAAMTEDDSNQNRTNAGGWQVMEVPNAPSDTTPATGWSDPAVAAQMGINPGTGTPQPPDTRLSPEQNVFNADHPNGGSFSVGQSAVGMGPGNRPLTAEESYFDAKYPNGGAFNAQGQPSGGTPNLPGGGGGVQDRGQQLLASGPGWAIDAHGKFSSTNDPDFKRDAMGFQGGYIGPGTIVQTKDIQDTRFDPARGVFVHGNQEGEAPNGNQDRGFRSYGDLVNGRPNGGPMGFGSQWDPLSPSHAPDFSQYGPQALQGGAYGNWSPGGAAYGPGTNMAKSQQDNYNATVGSALPGGAAAYGNPDYVRAYATGGPLNAAMAGGTSPAPAFGRGITGVMGSDGSFAPSGGGSGLPGSTASTAAAVTASGGGSPTRTGGLPGGSPASANPLLDQGQIMRGQGGAITGVASPNGYFDQRFQGYDNIIRNAQAGDPFALRDAKVLAAAGDQNAKAVVDAIGGLPDFARSQQAATWDQAHNQQIAGRIPAEFANNIAASQNLRGQAVQPPTNPASNFDALLSPDAHAQAMQALNQMGAQNVQIKDGYLSWTSASGKTNEIPFSITNSSALVAALQGNPEARAAVAQQNTGGGGGRARGGYGGYGGGNAGAALANEVTGIGGNPPADQAANQRIRDFFPNGGVSRATASAVGYAPAIQGAY